MISCMNIPNYYFKLHIDYCALQLHNVYPFYLHLPGRCFALGYFLLVVFLLTSETYEKPTNEKRKDTDKSAVRLAQIWQLKFILIVFSATTKDCVSQCLDVSVRTAFL